MNCWKCGTSLQNIDRKISFRALCDRCGFSLHCCKNCKNYAPGRSNDCLIPRTDTVADRELNNFCEEFEVLGTPPKVPFTPNKKSFDNLFK